MDSRVVVVGQGYVGLPVAMLAVERGMRVVGVDNDPNRVATLRQGLSPIEDVSDQALKLALDSGRYWVDSDYESINGFATAVITVPTPLRDAGPDLSFLEGACRDLAPALSVGATVIVESTTYPGTTEEFVAPLLEAHSGLRAGEDFALGFSPERIDPGNSVWTLANTPKIVSGVDEKSLNAIRSFYAELVDTVVDVPSPREAEMAKLLENTFRHVNIALVNELLIVARELGVDLWASIEAASTKPFGFMKFLPGPGVGGHCLPIDPTYLSWEVRRRSGRGLHFVELANEINFHMPSYVVDRAIGLLNDVQKPVRGARILLAGVAYKKGSSDLRESPALRVAQRLVGLGADVGVTDPHAEADGALAEFDVVPLNEFEVKRADLVILLTDHDAFDYEVFSHAAAPILDTRHRLDSRELAQVTYL